MTMKLEMNTVVVGIIYPKAEAFFDEYFDSLINQTTNRFEILLFNNGFESTSHLNHYLEKCRKTNIKANIIDVPNAGPSIIARQFVVDTLKKREDIDFVIFTDTDDYYDTTRVEKTISALRKHHVVINDEVPFNSGTREEYKSLFNHRKITKVTSEDMIKQNLIGYNNTGMRRECLFHAARFIADSSSRVTDWPLFASILLKGNYEAYPIYDTSTYYRQYQENTIGMKRNFTARQIKFGVQVKINQYQKMLNLFPKDQKIKEILESELKSMKHLHKALFNEENMQRYLNNLHYTSQTQIFCWWEHIDAKFL